MEVRKVERVKPPAYPDKEASLRDPALLLNTPERWKRNAAACAALAATSAFILTGCSTAPKKDTAAPQPPVFFHGHGFASFGGEMFAPAAYLTEEEAFEVVNEEAGKQGISFSNTGLSLDNIAIPETDINYGTSNAILGSRRGELILDGVSQDGKVAFEFVSNEDIVNWSTKNTISLGSTYDFKGVAEALSRSLTAETNITVGIFYDPSYVMDNRISAIMYDSGEDMESAEKKIKELVKEDLRAQVRDFIAWLKAQGII